MTREELINHIRYAIDIDADITLTNEDGEEIIRALVQEPCEDCISREETEKLLKCGCAYAIYDLPSVKPKALEQEPCDYYDTEIKTCRRSEVPLETGHWIKKGNTLTCPICGAVGEDIKSDYCFNYCPNCGAKMESEDKE